MVEVLSDAQGYYDTSNGMFGISQIITIPEGVECNIKLNNIDYVSTAKICYIPSFQLNATILGNASLVGAGDNTGETYAIGVLSPEAAAQFGGTGVAVIMADGSTSVTLSIECEQEIVKQLDPKFVTVGTIFFEGNSAGRYTCTRTYEEIVDLYFSGEIHKILPCMLTENFRLVDGDYRVFTLASITPENSNYDKAQTKDETVRIKIVFFTSGQNYEIIMTANACYANIQ